MEPKKTAIVAASASKPVIRPVRSVKPVTRPIPPMNTRPPISTANMPTPSLAQADELTGVLDIEGMDNHGVIRPKFKPSDDDVYLPSSQIRMLGLRMGDIVTGMARKGREGERYGAMLKVTAVNGNSELVGLNKRPKFDQLTPIYPFEKLNLATGPEPLSTRLIDLVAPIGKGQRGMIVAPPKAGKTTIIKEMATGMAVNHADVHMMAVLIGERPEEVTDIARHMEAITKKSK